METELDRRAREILEGNDRGGYTVPNGRVYPFQWNWDSAFVALGFASFDQDRAWREIETLFQAQWADGFLPHIVFWRDDAGYFPGPAVWATGRTPPTSGITQPPVAASVIRSLWARAKDKKAFRPRLEALFPKLLAWHRWFAQVRDPLGKGLVVATHPWETGRDNSPEWDVPSRVIDTSQVGEYQRRDTTHLDQSVRPTKLEYDRYLALVQFGRGTGWDQQRIARENPFRVADVGMTMILLRANRDLLALAEELGRKQEADELRKFIARSEAGVGYLWDEQRQSYCSRDVITGQSSGFVTSASFLSFYAGVRHQTRDQKMLAQLERIAGAAKYLMPSLDPEDPGFDSIRYWRGPVWAVVNYLIATGLSDAGHTSWAHRVRRDTRALIEGAGFFESYCPITGRGTGGGDFSWTAAMWLHWARHE
ncbi:MAG TPA: trehalase family glycosidase [Steroidobacter sp.]|uniref:MGH1-like glycoside hydrolase domain-containing protein n=1 Tax=Steroidobacter sp. TaxID=1978227 RepID=UPI002ED9AEDB